jgi:diguanylate cyclase (GGDEF)-like protein
LSAQVRTVDRIARLGGEEFALILVQADRAAALEVAQQIGATLRGEAVRVDITRALAVTVSAGVATLPRDAATAAGLIAAADQALYAAKSAGRDRAVGFNEL